MMHSIREQILRALMLRLIDAIAPTPVVRMPGTPISRDASPALLVFSEADTITSSANGVLDWALTLRLVALARGDKAFTITDQLMVTAHQHLMRDLPTSGLCLGVAPQDCVFWRI
ncbi:hypothetical protein AB833_01650 [Chromatiales bacterium (ex Bugula neritina AB1)]|nr:hypothetical protein AB833_01650 [Chromatiales bacterium (ex Bugula neritina AB1)]